MLTQCEWTSAAAIPQLEQEKSTLREAEQLINQLSHILSKKQPHEIQTINKTVLQIEGQSYGIPDEDYTHQLFVETGELVKRCARDLAGTRAAAGVEQKVAKEYREGIDKLRRRRLKEMGGEVQREHEVCLANILELQWHVSHTERKLESLRDKVRKKKRQHSLLKESEDHMTEHSPLAREKGEAERALSSVVQAELANTETEIEMRDGVRGKKRDIWKSEQIQAERARAEMLAEKNKLEGELSQATHELREADEIAKLLKDEIEGSTTQREINERECKELSKQEKECIKSIENIMKSTGNMEIHLKELKKQVSEFKQKSSDAEKELETELVAVEQEEKQLKDEVRKCNSQLHQARDDHETLLQDIDTLRETREKLKKETKDNSNTITRIQKQMVTLEQQVNVAEEEANNMREIHQDISLKFKQLENSVYQEETENKKIMSRIDKGLKEENHTLTVTQVKVQVEQKSLDKLIEQFHSKKETMTRVLSETESNRDGQKRQIEELQSRNEDLSNEISMTKNQLTELKVKSDNHITDIANSKSSLIPENTSLATKLSDVKLAIQKCESDNKSSSKKLDDVTSSSSMMEIMIERLAVEIAEMRGIQESTQEVLDVEREEKGALETEKEELKIFARNIKEKHAIFVQDKLDETSKTNDLLSEVIRNNAQLTGEYRREQSSHMAANTRLLQWTDEKLKLVSSLKDHKQLMGIQTRMHTAAQEYYKQRGTRSHQILARLVRDGENNRERSTGMKNLLDNAMLEIMTFLELYSKMSAARAVKKSKVTFSDVIDFDTTNRTTLPPIYNNKSDQ